MEQWHGEILQVHSIRPSALAVAAPSRTAQQQKVSISELVRTAVEKHLDGDLIWQRVDARQAEAKPPKTNLLDIPIANWTSDEEEAAHRAMQLFINHDE